MAKKKDEGATPKNPLLEGDGAAAEWVAIDTLKPWPGNPRKNAHAVPEIARSLEQFGWGRPLIARREDRELVIGHTTYEAARMLGLKRVPVRFVDLTSEKAHALAIADNKLGELAQWDEPMLLAQLQELEERLPDFDPADVGFAQEDLDKIEKSAGSFNVDPLGGAPTLPDGERSVFVTRSFTLHKEQAEVVDRALEEAKAKGLDKDDRNENTNGNALTVICGAFRP